MTTWDTGALYALGGPVRRRRNPVDSSYLNTRTLKEFWNVLGRGGVIAGTSAGATIQGDYLVRGDTASADVMMTNEPSHQHGFAFLKRAAIDQHINTRNRWDDLVPAIKKPSGVLSAGDVYNMKTHKTESHGR